MSTRILIIDNNQDHLDTLSKELLMSGNNVATFSSGEEGFEAFFQYQPHLFICEPVLAENEIRGWEIAFNILRDDPKVRPYMIALANVQNRTVRALCEETGYDEFCVKPIDLYSSDNESPSLLGWVRKAKSRAVNNLA